MRDVIRAALAYLAVVFAVAALLGTIRVLWLIPLMGEMRAVLIEVPLLLLFSWVVAGAALRRWPLGRVAHRAAMGAAAFAGLMALEAAVGRYGFGQSLAGMLATMGQPAGLIGLAGQIGFALIPAIRQPRG